MEFEQLHCLYSLVASEWVDIGTEPTSICSRSIHPRRIDLLLANQAFFALTEGYSLDWDTGIPSHAVQFWPFLEPARLCSLRGKVLRPFRPLPFPSALRRRGIQFPPNCSPGPGRSPSPIRCRMRGAYGFCALKSTTTRNLVSIPHWLPGADLSSSKGNPPSPPLPGMRCRQLWTKLGGGGGASGSLGAVGLAGFSRTALTSPSRLWSARRP